jgi:hypothetical protein
MKRSAEDHGLRTDVDGKMIKPENFAEIEQQITEKIYPTAKL